MRVPKADEATKRRLANYAPRSLQMKRDPNAPGVWVSEKKTVTADEAQSADWQRFVKDQLTGVREQARLARTKIK